MNEASGRKMTHMYNTPYGVYRVYKQEEGGA